MVDGDRNEAWTDADWARRPVAAEDIENAYRFFLGRNAETDAVVQERIGITRLALCQTFMGSAEFHEKIGSGAPVETRTVHPDLLIVPAADLCSWVDRLLPCDARAMGRDGRIGLFARLLRVPEIAETLDAARTPGTATAAHIADTLDTHLAAAGTIRSSPLFDEAFYRAQMPSVQDGDAALHYVLAGERAGLRPSTAFDPIEYGVDHPDALAAGHNLLVHRETSREPGEPADHAAATMHRDQAVTIRNSPLFDERYYRAQLGDAGDAVADAALHYLLEGESANLSPSASFDPALYADIHSDIAASAVNRLLHYEIHGRQEGRALRSAVDDLACPTDRLDRSRPTILLLAHEASHTGAPILGWNLAQALLPRYNVIVVARNGGTLETALAEGTSGLVGPLLAAVSADPEQLARLARRLVRIYAPDYVIANSYETRMMALALKQQRVPIVALIHEFATGHLPGIRSEFYARCAAIVFPARLVRESSARAFREIGLQNTHVLPQGPSTVPRFASDAAEPLPLEKSYVDGPDPVTLEQLLAQTPRGTGTFTVVGLGTVALRKGVDLFIAAATALQARHPALDFRFIWVGSWFHANGTQYGEMLEEQIARSGLGDRLHLVAETDDLERVYARADLLFLSSRLDPLPNVAIDAALREIPIVCFDNASGIAELLTAQPDTAALVVPHLDTGAAADRIAALAADPAACRAAGAAVGALGRRTFDMARYADAIDGLGRAAVAKRAQGDRERAIIAASGLFDPELYFQADPDFVAMPAEKDPVAAYLGRSEHLNFAAPKVWGVGYSRPMAGFHPFLYGHAAPGFPRDGSRDPFAHYIEHGRPAGPWIHDVIRIDDRPVAPAPPRSGRPLIERIRRLRRRDPATGLRVAMHGHFHYTDNIADFMVALAANRTRMDLFLTTSSAAAARILETATRDYRNGRVLVKVGSNVGRDIAPFIRVLGDHVLDRYDVVGHLHGKRSLHTAGYDKDLGNRWRVYLWEHLLGPSHPVADAVVAYLAAHDRTGLVFPESVVMAGWEKNVPSGTLLAQRLGLSAPLPEYIEFPVGTMFWARPDALRRLVDARLRDEEYPAEPLPIDGTMLHALERFLPLLCEDANYSYATTYLPHVRR